mmetsp:Transcript_2092/g.7667  ORF Transcript_2092/g.7667 Transcript_2092/m.7667 type:complete len:205 (+) Transcript_2092:1444-2058(+)
MADACSASYASTMAAIASYTAGESVSDSIEGTKRHFVRNPLTAAACAVEPLAVVSHLSRSSVRSSFCTSAASSTFSRANPTMSPAGSSEAACSLNSAGHVFFLAKSPVAPRRMTAVVSTDDAISHRSLFHSLSALSPARFPALPTHARDCCFHILLCVRGQYTCIREFFLLHERAFCNFDSIASFSVRTASESPATFSRSTGLR